MRVLTAAAVAALVSSVGVAAYAPSVSATTTTTRHGYDLPTMRHGRSPSTYYLAGRTIHTASGRTIRLPRSWPADGLQLLGKSPRGYVVYRAGRQAGLSGRGVERVYRVRPGSVKLAYRHRRSAGEWSFWFLSQRRRRIVELREQPYSCTDMVVLDLFGHRLAHKCTGPVDYLGSSNRSVWFQKQYYRGAAQKWDHATDSVTSLGSSPGVLADVRHGTLFVNTRLDGNAVGPTSLNSPGTPAWTADFTPLAVSPDGAYVAGLAGDMFDATGFDPDVEIRRMRDGQLAARVHFRRAMTYDTEMWWDNDSAVLLPVTGREHTYLVRCRLSGACRLAGHRLSAGDFSHGNQADWHDSSN